MSGGTERKKTLLGCQDGENRAGRVGTSAGNMFRWTQQYGMQSEACAVSDRSSRRAATLCDVYVVAQASSAT
jgi:hypothetical protein